jgi:hypothetical protein
LHNVKTESCGIWDSTQLHADVVLNYQPCLLARYFALVPFRILLGKQHRQRQQQQQRLVTRPHCWRCTRSGTASTCCCSSVHVCHAAQTATQTPAAAAAAAAEAYTGNTRSRNGNQQQQFERPSKKLSDSARDIVHGNVVNSSSHTSSSERMKMSGAVFAATLRECCPGSSADTAGDAATEGSAVLHGAAAAAAVGGSRSSAKSASGSSNATEITLGRRSAASKSNSSARRSRDCSTPAAAAAAAAAAANPAAVSSDSATVVVELGEQLGQLAELHRRQMSMSDCEVQDEVDQFSVNSFSVRSSHLRGQQQQQGALLLLPRQQQQGSTISRLSHAITSVSADMQMRRLAGAPSTASRAVMGSRPVTSAAGSAGLFSVASASPASRGSGLARSNTNNSSGSLAGSKEAAAAAAAAAEGPLVQTAAAVPPAWPLPESQPGELNVLCCDLLHLLCVMLCYCVAREVWRSNS